MSPAEFYHRERTRLLRYHGLLGPVWRNGSGMVRIPDPATLSEMISTPLEPEGEAWLRRRLAELERRGLR